MTNDNKNQQPEVEQEELESVEEIHEGISNEINEWQDKYKRALADYQNLEKRVREERGDLIRSANREILLRFLPILDTLLMARSHSEDKTLAICVQQFLDTLKSDGVTQINTIGKKFDPELMEVITTSNGKEGIIMSEVRPGYLLHDRLLRPAQVIVGNGELEEKEEN